MTRSSGFVYSSSEGTVVWAPDHTIYGLSSESILERITFVPGRLVHIDFTTSYDSPREHFLSSPSFADPYLVCNLRYLLEGDATQVTRLVLKQPSLFETTTLLKKSLSVPDFDSLRPRSVYALSFVVNELVVGTYALFFPHTLVTPSALPHSFVRLLSQQP